MPQNELAGISVFIVRETILCSYHIVDITYILESVSIISSEPWDMRAILHFSERRLTHKRWQKQGLKW